MNGLITDRFIEHFLKGLHRASKPGCRSEIEALEWSELGKVAGIKRCRENR